MVCTMVSAVSPDEEAHDSGSKRRLPLSLGLGGSSKSLLGPFISKRGLLSNKKQQQHEDDEGDDLDSSFRRRRRCLETTTGLEQGDGSGGGDGEKGRVVGIVAPRAEATRPTNKKAAAAMVAKKKKEPQLQAKKADDDDVLQLTVDTSHSGTAPEEEDDDDEPADEPADEGEETKKKASEKEVLAVDVDIQQRHGRKRAEAAAALTFCTATFGESPAAPTAGGEAALAGEAAATAAAEAGRRVRFSTVEIREYPRMLGDNPSVSSGPPLTLDWYYYDDTTSRTTLDVDEYESGRPQPHRTKAQMLVPHFVREEWLMNAGHSRGELAEATRTAEHIKVQRQKSAKRGVLRESLMGRLHLRHRRRSLKAY